MAALPVFTAFFLRKKLGVPLNIFLLCLLTGAASVVPAAIAQYFIPPISSLDIKSILFNVFCRVALTEESSRFLSLLSFLLFLTSSRKLEKERNVSRFAAMGLVAGLGFALAESAAYSANNIQIVLLRGFTTAPMHAACGARMGAAVFFMRESPGMSVWRFLSAVIIHGTYNILTVSPGIMRFFSILLVFSALFSAIKESMNTD